MGSAGGGVLSSSSKSMIEFCDKAPPRTGLRVILFEERLGCRCDDLAFGFTDDMSDVVRKSGSLARYSLLPSLGRDAGVVALAGDCT